uniref:hypothetical protein n=1 Tax=Fibrobacter sp. TaxID=35828 RepID=UPI00388DDA35
WQFKAFASDLSGTVDSSQFYNALFSIDRTAPKFSLRTDNGFVNPDSAIFLVRYKWADTLHGPDIRAMRWTLEGGCTMSAGDSLASDAICSGTVELPAMHDVAAKEFAMPWDSVSRAFTKKHGDGLYRVKAFAVDAA